MDYDENIIAMVVDGTKKERHPRACYLCGSLAGIDTRHGMVCGTSTCASFVIVERDIARQTLDEAEAAHDNLAAENALLQTVLVAAVNHLVSHGPCDDADDSDDPGCDDPACTYCALSRAVQALPEERRL